MKKIAFHRYFRKELDKLPDEIREAFYNRFKIFINNNFDPILNNHKVYNVFPNSRSINVTGDYRAIYEVGDDCLLFVRINKHSELYG
ncbi:type II toxin-antitoxin system mRNA interferase toxin, RelE/StbE family [Candidatus Falkowbacteria bacterium]|nr:type II toxin-antitoxin system mRNA interferase toxin, RelE/StbE family [Candidatus Falkowbacteria bacterium]